MAQEPQSTARFNLSAWALANQQLVAFMMLVIMAAGVMSYQRLPRNEDPAFTIKSAVVSAAWPGATVGDTVNFVTDKLEKNYRKHRTSIMSRATPEPGSRLFSLTCVMIRRRLPCRISGIRCVRK